MKNLFDHALQSHDIDHAHIRDKSEFKKLIINPSEYKGGIAIWGALNPVYDTHGGIKEDGVHVHARREVGGKKEIDETYDVVQVPYTSQNGLELYFEINGLDASNYNISTIFKQRLKYLHCPNCGKIHSDKDWYAVHPHEIHECEYCNHTFTSDEPVISNPIMLLKELCGDVLQDRIVIDPVERTMNARQERFKGGVQIWGSNPAILWTASKPEEGGIHFHGFRHSYSIEPEADETFGKVKIDGLYLNPEMVRHLMAQNGLDYLKGFIHSCYCPVCNHSHFDQFDNAVNPHNTHYCENCCLSFKSGSAIVANPLIDIFNGLAKVYQQFSDNHS
ncbi:hypothetical protein ACFPMF_16015 [Larkinella bovis]|uniref:Uncharacterized protein n=1 Tax=Larkinella bovis TaxID=683041 RepID=A0ABW0IDN5_9BACT